jgi:lipopolysaccharide export system protein LptC
MVGLLREAWDRFLLYLPLAVMATLALVTYWMVRDAPQQEAAQPARAERHTPDYFMESFNVKSYDASGRLKSELQGTQARHFADVQQLEIDKVRIRSIDAKGRVTTATADRGLSNEDGSELQLIGNAQVIREATKGADAAPRMEYRGEFLHAFLDSERVKSHKPVELTRGKDRFTADSLDLDNLDRVVLLEGRVRGTLVPKTQK